MEKTLGVAPVAWTLAQTLIAASAHSQGRTFEPTQCATAFYNSESRHNFPEPEPEMSTDQGWIGLDQD